MPIPSRKIIQMLKKAGWVQIRVSGDHHIFAHPERKEITVVPHPCKDVALGTLKSIEKQSRIKMR